MKRYYSNGKILLSGEYVILDGGTGLALPTIYGQSLEVSPNSGKGISWMSLDKDEQIWFEAEFKYQPEEITCISASDREIAERLLSILQQANTLNLDFLSNNPALQMQAKLDFPQNWGLGSSSTLVNNIAECFKVDAFQLQEGTFGGSGYDIAAAQHNHPVVYTRTPEGPKVLSTAFNPSFREEIFFVHLNKKQNSRNSIQHYRNQEKAALKEVIDKITALTHQFIACTSITEFEFLLDIHETLISQLIGMPKIKTQLFPDYPRSIKSLGGWGGDFILATGGDEEKQYFREKAYHTILDYSGMIL